MKLNLLTTTAFLAIAAAASMHSAKAQFTTTNSGGAANSEDLILSFADNTSGDNGATTNYEFDLGSADTYLNATSTIQIGNILTDLNATYSNFFTNPNLSISILGDNNSGATDSSSGLNITNGSIFVSLNNPLNPYPAQSNSTMNGDFTAVNQIYSPNSASSNLPTNGAAAGSFKVPTANSASFSSLNAVDGLNTQTSASFSTSGAPDLYLETLIHGAGNKSTTTGSAFVDTTGFFTVTSSGEVEYEVGAAATPEPSTNALMLLGAGILFWHVRRKSVSSL